ncbi:hypothetical protein KCU81_g551, partial [Aureobasidium melanogenum]
MTQILMLLVLSVHATCFPSFMQVLSGVDLVIIAFAQTELVKVVVLEDMYGGLRNKLNVIFVRITCPGSGDDLSELH